MPRLFARPPTATRTTVPAAIALREIRKVHGKGEGAVVALDDVSVELTRGSFTTIMGPSGSGKSTSCTSPPASTGPHPGSVTLGDARAEQAQRAPADDPAPAARRLRLPGVQPDAVADGRPEHRAAAASRWAPPSARAGSCRRRARRSRRSAAPPSGAALGRPAAARRDRARADRTAGDRCSQTSRRARSTRATAATVLALLREPRRRRSDGRHGHPRPGSGGIRRSRDLARRRPIAGSLDIPRTEEVAERLAHLGD